MYILLTLILDLYVDKEKKKFKLICRSKDSLLVYLGG